MDHMGRMRSKRRMSPLPASRTTQTAIATAATTGHINHFISNPPSLIPLDQESGQSDLIPTKRFLAESSRWPGELSVQGR
jgi:hypothetical protein